MPDPIILQEMISHGDTALIDGFSEVSVEGTKPIAFWINGTKYETKASWLDLRAKIVCISCTGHPQVLFDAIHESDFDRDFSTTQESRHWMRLDEFYGDVYLYAPRTADHSLQLTQFVLKQCAHVNKNYYIQIRKSGRANKRNQ